MVRSVPRTKPGLRIHIEPTFTAKLETQAAAVGLSIDDFVAFVLRQQAMGVLATSAPTPRLPGRPAAAIDDVPADAPRTVSGFVGVYARGSRWFAKLDKTQLGPFSTAEIAAIARYHHLKGYEHGLCRRLADAGAAAPDTPIPAPYNSDLPAAPQPGAPTDDLNLGGCPGCRKLGTNGRLCPGCIPLWAAWSTRPAPAAPEIGSIIDLKGSHVEESFAEYVRRVAPKP